MYKEKLHLGQSVTYDGRRGIVDALTQSAVGLVFAEGGYAVVGWDNFTLLCSYVGA